MNNVDTSTVFQAVTSLGVKLSLGRTSTPKLRWQVTSGIDMQFFARVVCLAATTLRRCMVIGRTGVVAGLE